jgi:hypothetical protein
MRWYTLILSGRDIPAGVLGLVLEAGSLVTGQVRPGEVAQCFCGCACMPVCTEAWFPNIIQFSGVQHIAYHGRVIRWDRLLLEVQTISTVARRRIGNTHCHA